MARKLRRTKLPKHRKLSVTDEELTRELEIRDTIKALEYEIKNIPDKLLQEQYGYAMEEVAKDGDLEHLLQLTRYVRGVVPLDEFLYSHTYLGIEEGELFPGVLETLEALESEQYVECVMKGAIGGGKMQRVDEPILTSEGWSTIGELQAGDRIYDNHGKLCNVVQVHPVDNMPVSYRVHFSDETHMDACADHLWYTEERTPRGDKVCSAKTTQYISDNLDVNGEKAHSIPLINGLQSIARVLRVNPYAFGAWLAENTSDVRRITGYMADHYGVRENKHIPADFLYGSHNQRVSLLQGLMDTAGHIYQNGFCEIVQTSARLADDTMQLLWLLGLSPVRWVKTTKGVEYHFIRFIAFRGHIDVFRIKSKLNKQPYLSYSVGRYRSRTIVAVEPIDPVPMRCITVDSPDRLYLAGRQMQVTHNTTAANLSMARQVYKISCMRNPQQTFGVQQHSSIVFTIQSVRLNTAKQAVFDEFGKFLDNSPYFKEIFPYDRRITSQMNFMQHHVQILPVSSSTTGAISMNVIGGLLDEVNFMQKISKSKNTSADDKGDFDQARELYLTLSKRRRSRFMHKGKLPGTLFLVSSSRYPDDFTEEKAAEAAMLGGDDPEIFVYSKSLWESKGRDRYEPTNFRVLIGNERQRSRILQDDEEIAGIDDPDNDLRIIEVPTDFRREFEKDIDGSVRDLAGQTTLASHPFIHNREALFDCMELSDAYDYRSVIASEDIDLEVSVPTILEQRVRTDVKQMRVAHIDLATTRDSAGVAVGHIAGTRTIERVHPETKNRTVEVLPVIAYDLVLRVMPPRDGEIDFSKIRQILFDLRDNYGLPIKVVTCDGFQSVDFRQILAKKGFASDYLSLDRTTQPYKTLRDALYDKRVILPRHQTLIRELTELEYVRHNSKEKVDHKPRGCFTGDTEIVLADGSRCRMDALPYSFEVRAYNRLQRRWVTTEGRNPRITKETTELLELELENGKTVRCTPEHLFLLTDGTYKQAQHLTEDDDLKSVPYPTGIKVLQKINLTKPVPVYDITVPETENFRLAAGPVVHNSKDVADAVAGVAAYLLTRRKSWTSQPIYKGTSGLMLFGNRTGVPGGELDHLTEDEMETSTGGRHSIKERRSISRMKTRRRKIG